MEVERESEKVVIPTVGVILIKNNKVLLVRHGEAAGHVTGVYGLPAGRFQAGEAEKEAAVRELKEETGLTTREENLLDYPGNLYTAEMARKEGGLKLFTIKVFICKKWKGILLSTPETAPEWVPFDHLSKYNTLPNVERAVHDARKFVEIPEHKTRNVR